MPGTNEHETGLAIDISAETGDDTRFEHTPHFAWLMAHAHEYGFILRYPQFKEKFTSVFYEPHHYRYVGREVATALHDAGLSLEEYCAGEVKQPARQAAGSPVYNLREIYRGIFGEKNWLMCVVTLAVYLVTLPLDVLLGILFRCLLRLVKACPARNGMGNRHELRLRRFAERA